MEQIVQTRASSTYLLQDILIDTEKHTINLSDIAIINNSHMYTMYIIMTYIYSSLPYALNLKNKHFFFKILIFYTYDKKN